MVQKTTGAMWDQLFQASKPIPPNSLSLQRQIRVMLVNAISSAVLLPGKPVPSSRDLAKELKLSRITVVLAYEQLVEEGFLISRARKGHFVSSDALKDHIATPSSGPTCTSPSSRTNWNKRLCLHPKEQRNIVKPSNWQSYPYPFLYGQFDKTLFPTAGWRECCMKTLSVLDIQQWAPDHIMQDDDLLLQQIQTKILPRRGVWASSEQFIITVGAQHALYMVADLLIRRNTKVAIEDPGYPDARNIFACRTEQIIAAGLDSHGLQITDELRSVDYIYTTPSHQCPTGVTMPLERREALLQMAQDNDFVIIEDDYESENNFNGTPTPALKSLDKNDRVIYIGSLTKSLAPGLRIGYIVAAPELIEELRSLRRLMLRHPTTFIQRALATFISLGHNEAQLRRLAAAQKERHQILIKALAQHAPQCTPVPVSGGGSCWVRLPEEISAQLLAQHALEYGVLIEPGDIFFMSEQKAPRHHIRLGYQSIPAKAITQGISQFGKALRDIISRKKTRKSS